MATLSELRALVRTQTETTDSELPNGTLDWYLQQAFDRTVAMENAWPSYETWWNLTLLAGTQSISIPGDCNRASINSLVDSTNAYPDLRLSMIDHETAEDYYQLANTTFATYPFEYSIWGGAFWLWPRPNYTEDRTYVLRGHRSPADWINGQNSYAPDPTTVDADPRLHLALAHYAIALAYAQQEDDTLEQVYMGRWQRDVEAARGAIMEPSRQQPMSFGGGRRDFRYGRRINVNTPL